MYGKYGGPSKKELTDVIKKIRLGIVIFMVSLHVLPLESKANFEEVTSVPSVNGEQYNTQFMRHMYLQEKKKKTKSILHNIT